MDILLFGMFNKELKQGVPYRTSFKILFTSYKPTFSSLVIIKKKILKWITTIFYKFRRFTYTSTTLRLTKVSIFPHTSGVTHRDEIAVVIKYVPQTLVSVVRGDKISSSPRKKKFRLRLLNERSAQQFKKGKAGDSLSEGKMIPLRQGGFKLFVRRSKVCVTSRK